MKSTIRQFFSGTIARQLTSTIVIFGVVATLITTTLQTVRDYWMEVSKIEEMLDNAYATHGQSLSASVWAYSEERIELELKGLLNTPGFECVEVKSVEGGSWTAGTKNLTNVIIKSFPLVLTQREVDHNLGTLTIVVGKQAIYKRLSFGAIETLLLFGGWTFLLAGILFLIFRQFVTRHLETLAQYTSSITFEAKSPPLVLDRPEPKTGSEDELEHVANAINSMRTELSDTMLDLRSALRDAERANQAKSEFLATMSHEFRTPLNAILGFSEMMRAQFFGPLGSDNYKEYANDIHQSGEHMLHLVNDVLDIAAIEAGKRTIDKEPIALDVLLKECIKKIEKIIKDGNILLSLDIPDNLPLLYADKRSVKQIALNILSNAAKFTNSGDTILLSVFTLNDEIIISVKDNGIGIPADKLSIITQPFTQAETNPHKAHDGSGLGLSIVKSLVEAHHGSLTIESEAGKGTTVIVKFPSQNKQPAN